MFLTYLIMMNIIFELWVIKPLTWTYGLPNHFFFAVTVTLTFMLTLAFWSLNLWIEIINYWYFLLILIDFTNLTWLWCWYHHLLNLSQPRVFLLSIPLFNLFWHMLKLKTLGIRIKYGKDILKATTCVVILSYVMILYHHIVIIFEHIKLFLNYETIWFSITKTIKLW